MTDSTIFPHLQFVRRIVQVDDGENEVEIRFAKCSWQPLRQGSLMCPVQGRRHSAP